MTIKCVGSEVASFPSTPNPHDSSEPNARLEAPQALDRETLLQPEPDPPEREAVRLLVIGSRPSVTTIVQTLHRLGFAEAGEWSPFLPGPNPGEVMRILMRYVLKP